MERLMDELNKGELNFNLKHSKPYSVKFKKQTNYN